MEYISSDTNIWLDFCIISRLDLPFRLPYKYIIYKEALREEIVSPPELLADLKRLGLNGVEISFEEFSYADKLATKYVKLSAYDRVALAIAKKRNITLLTGDNALRKAAVKEDVAVIGTIGILDRLYEGKLINQLEYSFCLESLLMHKERRLPEEEMRNRLMNLEKNK